MGYNYLNMKANTSHTHPEIEVLERTVVNKTDYEADKIITNELIAKKATIENLNATNAQIENLWAENAVIENLVASKADIIELKAQEAEIENLKATKAEIVDLEATKATIGVLEAETATINNLLAGNLTAGNIQAGSITANELATGTITAGSGVIAEGAIGNAQISNLDATKINAGTIDTSKINIEGSNGHMRMRDNRFQVFEGVGAQANERVSIGDVNGDGTVYGFRVRGKDGTTVLYDENGVNSEGITDGAITNDKISNSAEIDGAKLNIGSVINKINEDGTGTIEGFKISIEGTTLDTKLERVDQEITDHTTSIQNNTSRITANENSIKLKVDEQIYQTDKTEMTSTLDKNTSAIDLMKGQIALKVEQSHIDTAKSELTGVMDTKIETAKSEIKIETDKITQNVTQLGESLETKADGTTVSNLSNKVGSLETGVNGIKGQVSSLETTTTKHGQDIDKVQTEVTETKSQIATLDVTLEGITQRVTNTETTVSGVSSVADSKAKIFTSQPTTPYKLGDIWVQGTSGEIMKCRTARTTGAFVASDWDKASKYTDDTTANSANGKVDTLRNEYNSTKSQVAEIVTDLNSITQRVSNTETTTGSLTSELGTLKTDYSSTKSKVASIETNLNSITSRVSNVETSQSSMDGSLKNIESRVSTAEQKITDSAIINTVSKTFYNKTEVNNAIDGIDVGGRNLIINNSLHRGSYIDKNGTLITNTDWAVTDFIQVKPGQQIIASGYSNLGNAPATCFYNSSKGYVSGIQNANSVSSSDDNTIKNDKRRLVTVPNDCYFLRFSLMQVDVDKKIIKLERGNKPTDWTPAPEDVSVEVDTKITEAKSEIKIETDKITQSVSNLDRETSVNLISNSNFATNPKYTNWGFWRSGNTGGWYESQYPYFPTGEGIGLQLSKPNQSCTANSNSIPVIAGETYTVSMDLIVEKNVSKARISVREVHTDGTFGYEHNFDYATNYNGRTSNTITIQGSNTKQINVIIWNMGATSETSSYVVVFFNRIQLQRGKVATPWKLSVNNYDRINLAQIETKANQIQSTVSSIEGDYVGQSQLNQTVSGWEFDVKQPKYNLIRNSIAENDTSCWQIPRGESGMTIHYKDQYSTPQTGFLRAFGLYTDAQDERYAMSKRFKLEGGATYTISGWYYVGINNKGINLYVLTSKNAYENEDSNGAGYTDVFHVREDKSYSNGVYRHVTHTFTVPSGTKSGYLRVDNLGSVQAYTRTSIYWTGFMLNKGNKAMEWTPHPSETNDGITNVDSEGIKITHAQGSYTRINHQETFQANENGDRMLSMRFGGLRQYQFIRNNNGAKGYLGSLSATVVASSGLYGTSLFGTGNNGYLQLGFSESTDDNQHSGLNTWLVCNHYDGNMDLPHGIHTYKNLYVRSGSHFMNRLHAYYGVGFPYDGNPNNINSEISYISTSANATHGTRSLWLSGADNIYLNVQNGGEYSGHRIIEDGSSGAKLRHECWGNWDMKGWRISNVNLNYSLQDPSLSPEVRNYSYNRQATQIMSTKELIQDRGESFTYKVEPVTRFVKQRLSNQDIISVEVTDENLCECIVEIPDDIKHNISSYDVSIIKYGRGDIWVSERNYDYFIVKSENEISFTWVLEGVKLQLPEKRNYDITAFDTPVEFGAPVGELVTTPGSKFGIMDDDEIDEQLYKDFIDELKRNNELYKLYTKN